MFNNNDLPKLYLLISMNHLFIKTSFLILFFFPFNNICISIFTIKRKEPLFYYSFSIALEKMPKNS